MPMHCVLPRLLLHASRPTPPYSLSAQQLHTPPIPRVQDLAIDIDKFYAADTDDCARLLVYTAQHPAGFGSQ
eukprot:17470-Eustigmatos_ZCMA.PRE.1